jgi:2,4-dienoyl-CoA reductase-like NADH-dependent reductase (Old Yellow Enzyme family)
VPLVITESCAVDHESSTQELTYARLTETTVDGWAHCVDAVREAGGHLMIQLWHEGAIRQVGGDGPLSGAPTLSPSGLISPVRKNGRAATTAELADIKAGFARSARLAQQAGAVGVEVHSCHGYLLDQFLWRDTNLRDDGYGGPDLNARIRFPREVVAEVRKAVGPDFIVGFRFSQWKQANYDAKIAETPAELKVLLDAIKGAGADYFHASTRRFYTPEWPGSALGLAGWTKALTDLPVIACGSVGLDTDVMDNFLLREAKQTGEAGLQALVERFQDNEFDLVSVGRANIGDPDWVNKVRDGRYGDIRGFTRKDIMPATRNADGVRVR